MKNTDDMSMEDILASIRKYVASTNETSKYDKKVITPSIKRETKTNVVPINKAELEEKVEIELGSLDQSMGMSEKTMPQATEEKFEDLIATDYSDHEEEIVEHNSIPQGNLAKMVRRMIDEKIQKWLDDHLEAVLEKRLSDILEKVASEHLNDLLKGD
ncbi:MAG: DUF2497 domain-containing protein [Alphaproteobacteria bacterium]|nr:MAG: DUF2497 domain-containing protein [Alphaproteobacteria bacterium]